MIKCEECDREIDNYWDYLSDFYPEYYPPRDRRNDQSLYGIQERTSDGRDIFHYYCSEEHMLLNFKEG